MAMTLQNVSDLAKKLIRETVSDTVDDATMQAYVIGVYKDWCRELRWPEATVKQNTFTPGGATVTAQEYQLPDTTIKIFRVYLNGQRMVETSIPLLEGDVIQAYDPQWTIFPAVNPPQLIAGSTQAIPITAGPGLSQFSYYLRGGFIGFVPAPASDGLPIRLEGVWLPPDPAPSDTLLLPDQFKFGLAYGAIYRFLLGDRRVAESAKWEMLEKDQWGMAMRWRRDFGGIDQEPAVIPMPYRIWFGRANIRPGASVPTSNHF
jgi:hypothetical protein